MLAVVSGLILIAFGGITDKLIPLFAIGAFSAFVFSQAGMVMHWQRQGGRGSGLKLVVNALGTICTSIALCIIIVAKFVEGAWVTLLVVPGLVLLFHRIKGHYRKITQEIDWPVKLKTWKVQPPGALQQPRCCAAGVAVFGTRPAHGRHHRAVASA